MNLCIIPVRAGSKRLPDKNKKLLFGKPLYQYVIEAAIESKVFSKIILSTDDNEILNKKKFHYVDILERSGELSSDTASLNDVCLDILKDYTKCENFCLLYPTAALIDSEDIIKCYDLMKKERANSVISITKFPVSLKFALEKITLDYIAKCNYRDSQKYIDNGAIYFSQINKFMMHKTFFSENTIGYEMPRWKSVDVDTQEDFDLLEFYAKKYKENLC